MPEPRTLDLQNLPDADVVLLLHREDYYQETVDNKNRADIIIAKQRNGPTGQITLQFQSDILRFQNLSVRRPPPEPF